MFAALNFLFQLHTSWTIQQADTFLVLNFIERSHSIHINTSKVLTLKKKLTQPKYICISPSRTMKIGKTPVTGFFLLYMLNNSRWITDSFQVKAVAAKGWAEHWQLKYMQYLESVPGWNYGVFGRHAWLQATHKQISGDKHLSVIQRKLLHTESSRGLVNTDKYVNNYSHTRKERWRFFRSEEEHVAQNVTLCTEVFH